ncbi:DJ-1/PfpI family protein [Methylocystis parvus]|uniref:DJ-1/PfpI family protein n=1 Tax=Methylocystis parvus TaxID=134 RepID=UPI003C7162DA
MLQIAMLIYPQMFDVDLVGPLTFMRRLGDANVVLVWKDRDPVVSDLGVSYVADHDFDSCPTDLDILFVPGGLKGTIPAMQDRAVLDFLADRGSRARYVTSVCTGSLLLGAAGLLKGLEEIP